MKKLFMALLTVVSAIVVADSATAADTPVKAPPNGPANEEPAASPAESPVPAVTPEEEAALKQKDLVVRAELEKKIAELVSDPAKRQLVYRQAEERAVLCKHCHGENGNSVTPVVPSLAGQNPVYLVDQFDRFADDRRFDYWMSGLARAITDEDKMTFAVYYSSQAAETAGGGDPKLLDKGKQLFEQFCVECHGADGKGKEGYARVAGQQPTYVVKMLEEFKQGTGHRYDPWMAARANMLATDEDMQAVASYVANLK